MTCWTYTTSSNPMGHTLEWDTLPPLSAVQAPRDRVRHRLTVAMTGLMIAGLVAAAMAAVN